MFLDWFPRKKRHPHWPVTTLLGYCCRLGPKGEVTGLCSPPGGGEVIGHWRGH